MEPVARAIESYIVEPSPFVLQIGEGADAYYVGILPLVEHEVLSADVTEEGVRLAGRGPAPRHGNEVVPFSLLVGLHNINHEAAETEYVGNAFRLRIPKEVVT